VLLNFEGEYSFGSSIFFYGATDAYGSSREGWAFFALYGQVVVEGESLLGVFLYGSLDLYDGFGEQRF